MTTLALLTMLTVQLIVTLITAGFLYRTLQKTKQNKAANSIKQSNG